MTSKKTVVSVGMFCSKCKRQAMKNISKLEGVDSVVLDASKQTVTVIGETDPVDIIKQLRKFRKNAQIVSVGPPKPDQSKKDDEEKKKDNKLPVRCICSTDETWFIFGDGYYSNPCSVL